MNVVVIKGRLTRDPEIKYTNGGSSVALFSVACDRRVKRGDQWENEPDFISCVAFGKTAETIEKYFHKGSEIIVDGSIKTGSYEKDGKKIYTTDVIAERVEFCGSKSDSQTQHQPQNDGFMSVPDGVDDEDLPFN